MLGKFRSIGERELRWSHGPNPSLPGVPQVKLQDKGREFTNDPTAIAFHQSSAEPRDSGNSRPARATAGEKQPGNPTRLGVGLPPEVSGYVTVRVPVMYPGIPIGGLL